MKALVLSVFVGVTATLFGTSVSVTNELLTVDQNNNPSVPGVLGTVSDLARLEAQTEINAAAAVVASDTYDQCTNLLDSVAAEIAAERTVVYRKFFIDSFTAAIIIDPAVDKVGVYGWEQLPSAQQDQPGRVKWYAYFGCTVDISSIMPQAKHASNLSSPTAQWEFLADQYVTDYTPLLGTWTDRDGNTYGYLYRLTCSLPSEVSHFMIVSVSGDAPGGSGDTLTAVGGFTGGITTNVVSGSLSFEITGGLFTGVTNSNANASL